MAHLYPFIVDLPIKKGDFPWLLVCLQGGKPQWNMGNFPTARHLWQLRSRQPRRCEPTARTCACKPLIISVRCVVPGRNRGSTHISVTWVTYMYIYTYTYIYIHIYIHIYIMINYDNIYIHTCIHIHLWLYMHINIVNLNVHIDAYFCVSAVDIWCLQMINTVRSVIPKLWGHGTVLTRMGLHMVWLVKVHHYFVVE